MHTALNGHTRVGVWQNGKRVKWLEQAKLTNISTSATLVNPLEKDDKQAERNSELSQSQHNSSNEQDQE
jgi:hypothetical protein